MRKKIINVFAKEDYYCFGCSPHNPIGLQLQFVETEEGIETEWSPRQYCEGYPGVVHGGIQATLMDEIAAWVVYIKVKCSGVTSRLNIKYAKPVDSHQDKVLLKAKLREVKRSLAYIDVVLINEKEEICASAEAIYFLIPHDKAVTMNYYPECYEDFFE
ncbi:MAG: PaaI family thioesterase [Bacteroidales bacterium]|jgi:uncharacterized protein (TIGR00369 family)|nr:PaaI family thioesterase [Bacteroidales bacterium]